MRSSARKKLEHQLYEYVLETFGKTVVDHCKFAELRTNGDSKESELVLHLILPEEK